jgi:hypothetical protein
LIAKKRERQDERERQEICSLGDFAHRVNSVCCVYSVANEK